ncbi:hypothetical protein [Variovorax sp. N23]|uniref:hypothetical protein n=1 Tax=Variovorax sp. N23 TaxID=2980555 RepID=UPI0021C69073|nr:hypothetical protein [Variovorax sp. N23]MCU4121303.1 hypothetical protein [Variovorax sp. N23]
MNELVSASVALASLHALALWARTASTRAWGDGAPASHRRAWAVALGTVALQGMAAVATTGIAAGLALVLASWMLLGWLLVLSMNQWPAGTLRWAPRLGAAGCAGCALALAWALLQGPPTWSGTSSGGASMVPRQVAAPQ